MKTLSIVIPVFNEQKFVIETLRKVARAKCYNLKKEIIIIDDASTDNTLDNIKKAASSLKRQYNIQLKLLSKTKNEGKGAAVKDGILASTGDIVIIQDADQEYSPDEYTILLQPILEGEADVVFGSRFISDKPHRILYFWHSVGNSFLTLFSNMLTNLNLTDMETGYKVFKGEIIRGIAPRLKSKRFGFEPEVTARLAKIKGLNIYEVAISYHGRTYAEGKKIGWRDGLRAIWEILRYNLWT